MDLKIPTKLDQGATIAELSRPARTLKRKFKARTRKPQGQKAFRTPREARYTNWFSPFLFQMIESARIMAGGPNWSTRAIERELKKKDSVSFEKFNRKTIDTWIDRSGNKPRWSDKTLVRIKKGNDVENPNAGRKSVLVSQIRVFFGRLKADNKHTS
jgi:hypothetical protein